MKRPGAADAIVVLGTRVRADGTASAALRRRVAHGAALYHSGLAPFVVLTGGPSPHGAVEAEVMHPLMVEAGVPAGAVVIEPTARSTFENALCTARLAHPRGWRSVLVVTERYHLPRALYTFRRTGLAISGSPAPSGPAGRLQVAVRAAELAKWPWYMWRIIGRDGTALREVRRS